MLRITEQIILLSISLEYQSVNEICKIKLYDLNLNTARKLVISIGQLSEY
jgi:hypothetical protein